MGLIRRSAVGQRQAAAPARLAGGALHLRADTSTVCHTMGAGERRERSALVCLLSGGSARVEC